MKKIISILISILIIFGTVSIGIVSMAEDSDSSSNSITEESLLEVSEMISEYDAETDYVSYSEYCEENQADVSIEDYEEEYQFQTARLIVRTESELELLNSVDYSMYDNNTYIIQFENDIDAQTAYEYYSSLNSVEFVEPDTIAESYEYNPDNSDFNTYDVNNIMSEKSAKNTNLVKAKQYLLDNVTDFKDVYVAVIDSGINKKHEALNGRFAGGKNFVDLKSNITDGGYDDFGHGTKVAGVVVENTLPNVKILSYKIYNSSNKASLSNMVLAVEQAIIDKADVINISLGAPGLSNLLTEVINKAYDNNITVVAASGNDVINLNKDKIYPACYENVIAVGAADNNKHQEYYSNYGKIVQIYAPGEVNSTDKNGGYVSCTGTSYASPCVAAECANIKTLYPNEENEIVKQRILDGSDEMTQTPGLESIYFIDMYNCLIIKKPEINFTIAPFAIIETDEKTGKKTVTLACNDKDAIIYYYELSVLSNQTPKLTMSTYNLYSEPLEYSTDKNILFFAQSKTKKDSDIIYKAIRFGHSENGFYCNDEGIITSFVSNEYDGNPNNIVVPDTIDSIIPVGFKPSRTNLYGFFGSEVENVIFPDTITEISDRLFKGCVNLKTLIAPGIITIGSSALYGCQNLTYLKLSILESISEYSFYACRSLNKLPDFEKLVIIPDYALNGCEMIKEICAPNCTWIKDSAIANCTNLKNVYMPKLERIENNAFSNDALLKEINFPLVTFIGDEAFSNTLSLEKVNLISFTESESEHIFSNSGIKVIDLYMNDYIEGLYVQWFRNSYLDSIHFPNLTMYIDEFFEDSNSIGASTKRIEFEVLEELYLLKSSNHIMSVPSSTINIMAFDEEDEKANIIIYGTNGSYASKWCTENNVEFRNISQETALMNDVPAEVTELNTVLTADVIGFNRTYQWYANTHADNTTGTAIKGATDKTFTPSDYPSADYYYCVVTSKDGDYDAVTIRTGVTKNNYVDEPVTEPTTEPSTQPTKPTEPSTVVTEPTKPSTENTTESTTVQNTNPVASANETTSEVGTTDNPTVNKPSQNKSTSSQSIKKNNSKISPSTGVENDSAVIFFSCIIILSAIIIFVKRQKTAD